jgi:ferredoxin-like protein FixX
MQVSRSAADRLRQLALVVCREGGAFGLEPVEIAGPVPAHPGRHRGRSGPSPADRPGVRPLPRLRRGASHGNLGGYAGCGEPLADAWGPRGSTAPTLFLGQICAVGCGGLNPWQVRAGGFHRKGIVQKLKCMQGRTACAGRCGGARVTLLRGRIRISIHKCMECRMARSKRRTGSISPWRNWRTRGTTR